MGAHILTNTDKGISTHRHRHADSSCLLPSACEGKGGVFAGVFVSFFSVIYFVFVWSEMTFQKMHGHAPTHTQRGTLLDKHFVLVDWSMMEKKG